MAAGGGGGRVCVSTQRMCVASIEHTCESHASNPIRHTVCVGGGVFVCPAGEGGKGGATWTPCTPGSEGADLFQLAQSSLPTCAFTHHICSQGSQASGRKTLIMQEKRGGMQFFLLKLGQQELCNTQAPCRAVG